MRELNNDDMMLISEILDKTGIEIPSETKYVDGQLVKKTQSELGMEIIMQVGKKIYKAKKEINQLLQSVFEIDGDVSKMPFKETKDKIKELIGKEGFLDFFK